MYLDFGKHKGKHLEEIPLDYLSWIISFHKNSALIKKAKEELSNRGYNLKDLEEETDKLLRIGVFNSNGTRNWDKIKEIKREEAKERVFQGLDQLTRVSLLNKDIPYLHSDDEFEEW